MKRKLLSLFVALVATTALWASTVITYTATEKLSEVTDDWDLGLHTNAFNVAITSHEFSNGTGTITFAGEVTTIGDYAFLMCSGLTSVTIPNSVTTIGYEAFYECSGLTSVTIPNSVKTIGRSAFYGCSGLTSVTIGNSVTTIGEYAFRDCSGLTSITIPNSVTTIGGGAFQSVNNIVYNGIATGSPWGAKYVNGYVDGYFVYSDASKTILCGCSSAATGDITIPNSVTTIGDWAFYYCTGLTSVTIPNSVTTIGEGAFYSCSGLTSVTIPNSVTTIGDYAFNGCSSLTSVTIPNSVTTIGEWAFSGCFGLTSVTIPNSVTTIGGGAFYGCSGLTSITIPNSVTTIGEWAFAYCSGLISITIGNSVTTIGEYAFQSVNNIVYNGIATGSPWGAKYVNGYVDGYFVYSDASKTILCGCSSAATGDITIPNSVTTIGEGAFYSCSGLTSVTIPNSVTTIGDDAFNGCSGLTSVTIPNSVTTIGDDAFNGCSSLTSVTIPSSVTTIGDRTFQWCYDLTSVTIPNSVTTIGVGAFSGCTSLPVVDNLRYADTYLVEAVDKTLSTYTIKDGTKWIGDYAFYYCTGLTSITIPNSVTTIGDDAFEHCSGLTSVTCYAENPPSCGSKCFDDVPKYIPLCLPYYASKSAYKSAEGWKDFTNIIIQYFDVCGEDLHWKYKDGTLFISGTGDMYDFTQTDSPWLDLKDSVTNIIFPSNLTSIGNYAFYGFSKLTSVTIPNTVTTIGESAFENCTYLKTITLGKALTNIGCKAFKGDYRIEEITSYAEVTPNVCSSTFDGLSKQYIYLYVPENSIRGYQVDPNWNDFDIRTKAADKKPIDGDNPIVTPTDQDVTITWPITDGTDTYTLTITKNGEVVCVLTFNANGQLTNIAFAAPGHNGAHQAPAATLTAQGYQFTVTGLNPGTAYDYSVTATDAGGKTLAEHKGNFSTTGGTGLESVHGSQCTMHKVLRNGQLLIETNNATYTPMGQKVK